MYSWIPCTRRTDTQGCGVGPADEKLNDILLPWSLNGSLVISEFFLTGIDGPVSGSSVSEVPPGGLLVNVGSEEEEPVPRAKVVLIES